MITTKHTIDTDTQPFIPEGWSIEEHRKGGQLEWNSENISLYLTEVQKSGGSIKGHDLRNEFSEIQVLNACVLEFLMANPLQIPREWRGVYVFFWGTIYRHPSGKLLVRSLYCMGKELYYTDVSAELYSLEAGLNSKAPAAVLAS